VQTRMWCWSSNRINTTWHLAPAPPSSLPTSLFLTLLSLSLSALTPTPLPTPSSHILRGVGHSLARDLTWQSGGGSFCTACARLWTATVVHYWVD